MGSGDGVRCMLMRGGTSKGAYFLAEDLPQDPAERDDLLLRIMGSPDARQIDGIGGAHPLTSKVAVISPSARADADVDYLFLQVGVETAMVSDRQNCGNLLAGVGPFAVERGLVRAAPVRIHMVNSGSVATARFPGADGVVDYDGDVAIAGVPGTAAPANVNPRYAVEGALDPEQAFTASIAACHMLWFLDVAARAGFVVERYADEAEGTLAPGPSGKQVMTRVLLRPKVVFSGERLPTSVELEALHHEAHEECFIANSVKTEIVIESR